MAAKMKIKIGSEHSQKYVLLWHTLILLYNCNQAITYLHLNEKLN